MAMVINTNMASLNAVRMLDRTSGDQSTAMERLTSGMRINKAADDAAGLAVATGMTTQIMGTDMAIRNANDSIGMLQTLDGASEEVMNMLQRMRELGVQAMNGTYNNENRAQMQSEFYQLQSEVVRIADTTKFNGMNIMNSSSFGPSGVISAGNVAASAIQVAASSPGAFKAHVGWEAGNDNRIGVALLDFNTLAALDSANIFLMSGNGSGITFGSALGFASAALSAIDSDIDTLSTMRANWGALQNRMESTVSNLQNINENINAARSRIMDTDFAKESAELARTQVLQQAGMSMLSQANQQSQQVMSLLQ
ncbi:flagellin [Thiosulfatimonas sediminis]|uniref:Flagellin n=1 Tax=Thiosulfatimonas sediminis TaxID=2675054 RepID=A0A6F8PU20_9GAMM|nr:flagellin [Thiosulfatimonas sediminis]BBP45527.1 flagellin [Thiosulfatimonas sediminis]